MNFVTRASALTLALTTMAMSLANCHKPSTGSAIRPFFGFEIVDLNNDGIDDIVGASTNGMAVVDGKTFKARMVGIKPPEMWRLLDGKIVTTARETPRVLQVVELRSGTVLKTFQLSDKVATLTQPPSTVGESASVSDGSMVLSLIDHRNYILQLNDLTLREQPQAQAQAQPVAPQPSQPIFCAGANAACSWDDKTSSSPNVATITQGSQRISVRIKQPGTRELSVVCFDGAGRESAPVLLDEKGYGIKGIDLADGRLFVSYLGGVNAYNANTCAPQWQRQELAAEVLQAQRGRLYVTTAGHRNYGKNLIILDAATGTLLGAP